MNDHVGSIINNSKFVANRALSFGGVIVGQNIASLKVKSSRFDGNQAKSATSLFLVGSFELDVTDCAFSYNVATSYNNNNDRYSKRIHENALNELRKGGGSSLEHTLVLDNIVSSTIDSSQFISNKGGAIHLKKGQFFITSCEFTNNSALFGGAVSASVDTDLFVININGAIDVEGGELSIASCEFTNNSALFGGAVNTFHNAMVTVKNSSFLRNNAKSLGGAIFGRNSTVIVFRNSFTENTAHFGGAVNIQQAEVKIVYTNFTQNKAWTFGGAVTITSDAPFTIRNSTFKY